MSTIRIPYPPRGHHGPTFLFSASYLPNPRHALLFSLVLFLLLAAQGSSAEPVAVQTIVVTVGPTIPTNAPEFVDGPTFTSAVLNSTNTYRGEHNASAVHWNATLERFATDYLGQVVTESGDGSDTCKFAHSGGPYGENIALGCSNATSCVEAWGNERAEYDFRHPDFSEQTGHFSQLVWKNTTDVGCGARFCNQSGGWYFVCEYWPRGNVIGQFTEEVGAEVGGGAAAGARPPSGWSVWGLGVLLLILWVSI
jgi:uncharacterized protein YkwD